VGEVNARINAPSVAYIPTDLELERQTLGLLLLGYELPTWLEPEDFFWSSNQLVFRAISALSKRHRQDLLPRVARLLRNKGHLYTKTPMTQDRHSKPGMLSSVDLAAFTFEAQEVMIWGWAVEVEHLRELRKRRELLDLARRAVTVLEHDGTASEAAILRKAM
jgi:replicative DNA helicase